MDIREVHPNLPVSELIAEFCNGGMDQTLAIQVAENLKVQWRRHAPRAFMISPATLAEEALRAVLRYAEEVQRIFNMVAITPVMALNFMVVDQDRQDEYEAFCIFAEQLVELSKITVVVGNEISPEMQFCVTLAMRMGKPIYVYDKNLMPLLRHIALESGVASPKVVVAKSRMLAMSPAEIIREVRA